MLKEEDINYLLSNKKIVMEQSINDEMNVKFINVKPGSYKFVIL